MRQKEREDMMREEEEQEERVRQRRAREREKAFKQVSIPSGRRGTKIQKKCTWNYRDIMDLLKINLFFLPPSAWLTGRHVSTAKRRSMTKIQRGRRREEKKW